MTQCVGQLGNVSLSTQHKVREKEQLSNAERPSFDVVLMFKVLILKSLYNLSDEMTELMIRGRISFMEFLGLTFADTMPDAKTIWPQKSQYCAVQLKELGLERKNKRKTTV